MNKCPNIEIVAEMIHSKIFKEDKILGICDLNFILSEFINKSNGTIRPLHSPSLIEIDNNDDSFIINISPYTSISQDNFLIAHALGHYYLHYFGVKDISENMSFCCGDCLGKSKREKQANRFALNLLMPKYKIDKLIEKFGNNRHFISSVLGIPEHICYDRLNMLDNYNA